MPYESALPNQNKGYAKQEKKDLMNDMPIDKRASGGSWMSKHSQSKMGGSPLMAAKPDYIDIDNDGNTSESMKEAAKGAPTKMISPLRHEREDKKEHLHGRIEKKTGKLKPIINKQTGERLPEELSKKK